MSINVTVHGNPVSIKRGKMVALDGNKEFELRRITRLQQVRQQSKRIAEDVRNKVRREKNKQFHKCGDEVQAEFKAKQNKKLTCLKEHFTGCMADFGRAFGDAENEPDSEEIIQKTNEKNRHQAELRGKTAEQVFNDEKNAQKREMKKHVKDMKHARYIENLRSKLVADLSTCKNPKNKRNGQLANIQINGETLSEEGSINNLDIFNLSVLEEGNESTSGSCDYGCKAECSIRESSNYNQEEENIDNSYSNEQTEEIKSRDDTEVHTRLPVCDKSSKGTTSYYSHKIYRDKNKPVSKTSVRLVAIADSLKQIAEEYNDDLEEAPCEKVHSLETSNKQNLSCFETRKSACTVCDENSPVHISEDASEESTNGSTEFTPQSSELALSVNDLSDNLVRPVIMSAPTSPKKRKSAKRHQMSDSPERQYLFPFRKTLISNKNAPKKQDADLQHEFLEIVTPVKIKQKKKISPLKLNKKKSSIHDANYFVPTEAINVMKKMSFPNVDYQLPTVPTTVIRPDPETRTRQSNVKYYDHFNRFSKEEPQPTLVQKISKEDIDILPDDISEIQLENEVCKKRDQEAKMRGSKALEKVKIHQDYQKLLQELPILQRQERLANMPMHKPSLHMTNERYQEYERKKQNAMENKFENMQSRTVQFDKPNITLKSIRKLPPSSSSKVPLKTLDVSDENTVLNAAQWKTINSSSCSEQPSSNTEASYSRKSSDIAIADLLKRVNKQRELLLKEAVNMKSLGSLQEILNEDELINIICNCPPRQKILVETGTSPLNKNTPSAKSSKQTLSSRSKSPKRSAVSSSDTSVEVTRPKAPKVKKFKVYLREEATQTSPLLSTKSSKKMIKSVSKKEGITQTSVTSHSLNTQKSKRRLKNQRLLSNSKSLVVSKTTCQESSSEKSDRLCEIIIRAGDQNVKINPISNGTKKDSPKKDIVIKIQEAKAEIRPKNALEMSSSTCYMSPPIVIKSKEKPRPAELSMIETSRSSNRHLLQPQKQQTNLDNLVRIENGAKEINPRLVKYIMRLLNMSRQSIDELTISSVSDVSTPQQSIIQTTNNIAREKLQTVMDHFHLSADDIKKFCLSSSSLSDITAEIRRCEEKEQKESPSQPVKQFACTSTSNEKDEGTQHSCKEKQSLLITSEKEKKLEENREIGYRASKSRSPQLTISTQNKDFSSEFSGKLNSNTITQETKTSSSQRASTSPTSRFRPSSPRSTMKSTKSSKNTSIKVAVPKLDITSEPCSTERTTVPSSIQQIKEIVVPKDSSKSPTNSLSKLEAIPKFSVTTDATSSEEAMLKKPEKFLQFVRESLGMSVEEFTELGFEEMFSRHMELTEYCHDRIRSLMSLIEQIRNEKREICSSSSPVNQSMTLTSYLDLPPSKSKQTNVKEEADQDQEYSACLQSCLENEISSGSSISQDAIDKYLLAIGSDTELNGNKKIREEQTCTIPEKKRLQSGATKEQCEPQHSFIPMLQGIPKYSESSVVDSKIPSFLGDLLHQIKPKPPPALLRSNMRGHTNETPHELSTIVEADTFISSRNTSIHRPQSPEERIPSKDASPRHLICVAPKLEKKSPSKKIDLNKSSDQSNSSGAYVTISPERIYSDETSKNGIKQESDRTSEHTPDTATKSGLSGIQSLSETSQETADELEAMLKKFKLEWAISLVKKTEQALALSSSSSSSDVRGKKDVSSDVSVRESFRHLCKKLARLNDSDIERAQVVSDLSHHFREFHDISEIPGVADSKNKSHQRTSTPVQHSKSTESKKSITNESFFKVDSELSSVKNSSDENYDQLFLSIPNVTLNTDHISLTKS